MQRDSIKCILSREAAGLDLRFKKTILAGQRCENQRYLTQQLGSHHIPPGPGDSGQQINMRLLLQVKTIALGPFISLFPFHCFVILT